ncbi:MAG TPA: hypothetical protein VJ739_16150, partial [Gemmataceae bacterium]|nr:hypothetical protein [Gemmataceae bacterium]
MAAGYDQTITLNNTLTISSTSNPPQQPPNSLIAGGSIGGPADLVIQAGLNWVGGTMFGSGTTWVTNLMNAGNTDATVNASLTINAPSGVTLDQRTLDNQAKTTWTDGPITTISALIENDAGQEPEKYLGNASFGEFEIAANNSSSMSDPNAPVGTDRTNSLFSNEGSVLKDATFPGQGGTSGIFITFNNDSNSSVTVAGGGLTFLGGGASSGTFQVDLGGNLSFLRGASSIPYTWNSGAKFLGPGDTLVGADVVVGKVYVANEFTFGSGTISGPGTIQFSYLFHWTGGSFVNGGTAEVLPAATATAESVFVPPPSLVLSGWDLIIDAGAVFKQDGANIAMGNGALIN